jgi:replicative DNA helicase
MPFATPAGDGDAVPLGLAIDSILDGIEAETEPDLPGIPTGFRDYDALTGGLQSGHLVVIAGRPSAGKSVLATDLARSCSIKHGRPSVIFTVGNRTSDAGIRVLSAEARVPLHRMRNGTMSDEDRVRIKRRKAAVSEAPLFIVDGSALTVTDIAERCRRLRGTRSIELVIIDFINGLSPEPHPLDNDDGGAAEPDEDWEAVGVSEISEITRRLKNLARELEIPIVAFVQLERVSEGLIEKSLDLDDLRDGDSLAENADVVVLLHRDDLYDAESPRAGEADLIVAKHRNGPTYRITVAFQGAYARFVDMA